MLHYTLYTIRNIHEATQHRKVCHLTRLKCTNLFFFVVVVFLLLWTKSLLMLSCCNFWLFWENEKRMSHQTFSLLISESCHLVALVSESHWWTHLSNHKRLLQHRKTHVFPRRRLCGYEKYTVILIRFSFSFFLIHFPSVLMTQREPVKMIVGKGSQKPRYNSGGLHQVFTVISSL